MWRPQIFRVPNKLFSNFAKLCTSGPHLATEIGKIWPQNAQKSPSNLKNSKKFAIRHKKSATKSKFGEKLPNFFNLYIDFFTEMHKIN